jgi:hypothetical protein
VNVVYGVPTSFGFAYLRPDLLTGAPLYLEDSTAGGGRRINPAAFAVPASARQGALGRNSLRGFPLYQVDVSLQRRFKFTDGIGLQLRVDAFNLFNHPNFEDPAGAEASLGSLFDSSATLRANPRFGQSLSTAGRGLWGGPGSSFSPFYSPGGARNLQLSVRLEF